MNKIWKFWLINHGQEVYDTLLLNIFLEKLIDENDNFNQINLNEIKTILKVLLQLNENEVCNILIPIHSKDALKNLDDLLSNNFFRDYINLKITLVFADNYDLDLLQLTKYYFDAIVSTSLDNNEITEYKDTLLNNKKFIQKKIFKSHETNKNILTLLTEQERKILKSITSGKRNKEIADELFISPNTVKNHKANIIRKLELKNSLHLQHYAFNNVPFNN